MTQIIQIMNFEEGYREKPYLDTLGYPTVAGGIKIGPQGASLANYIFTVPKQVGDVWKLSIVTGMLNEMKQYPSLVAALAQCNPARQDVLQSMAYQMGVPGLVKFKKSLIYISNADFTSAANEMLNSSWAKTQSPSRAKRHADVMRTGNYDIYKGLI
ncbi:lysozyme [Pantoea sp. EABMAA-21]|uniref:lysozyme n=1 Tax=Pantoea sp. EABMAA-21 TaxID=3043302 RepID=UPI0024B59629|nr:lysozyme [Pantoea sp. EABMAA-21]MDI9276186.1 lysozyme [Pantoea sp. EABMAA-21]